MNPHPQHDNHLYPRSLPRSRDLDSTTSPHHNDDRTPLNVSSRSDAKTRRSFLTIEPCPNVSNAHRHSCHSERSEPTPFLRVRFLRTRRLAQRGISLRLQIGPLTLLVLMSIAP